MTRKFFAAAALGAAMLAGCRDDVPTSPAGPAFEIKDGAHSAGNQHFYFLPPLVPPPASTGTFDGSQAAEVQICTWINDACGATIATYSTTSGVGSETVRMSEGDQHYLVNWHTDQFSLDPALTYRIRVLVAGAELGHADVDVVNSGKELKNVNTGEFVPLLDGRTLPIKFRIEMGAVTVIGPDGGSIQSDDGNATITIPPGMFSEPVGFTVQPVSIPAEEIAAAGLVAGTAYEFGPDGMVFPDPEVTVALRYDPANLGGFAAAELTLLTNIDGSWAQIPGPTVDPVAHTVSAKVGHFSTIVAGVSQFATIDDAYVSMFMGGGTKTATHTIGEYSRFVAWQSLNPEIATIMPDGNNDGVVTAVAPGEARIRLYSSDPYYGWDYDEAFVKVFPAGYPAGQYDWIVQREGITGQSLFGVGDTSPTDVFLVGFGGTVIHYDGVNATLMPTPTTCTYRGVWARAPDDVYVVGRCAPGFGSRLLRYDGASWSVIPVPGDALFWNLHGNDQYVFIAAGDRFYRYSQANGVELVATFPASIVIRAVAAEGSDLIAVGQDGANGIVIRSVDDGVNWTAPFIPENYFGNPASGPLVAIWRDPATNVAAAATLDGRVVMSGNDGVTSWLINEQLTNVIFEAITSKPQLSPFVKPDVFLGGDNGEMVWAERCRCGFGAPGFRADQSVYQHILGLWTDGPTGRVWGVGTAGLIFRQNSSTGHTFDVLSRGQSFADVWVHPNGRVIAPAGAVNNEVWMSSAMGAGWFGASLLRGGTGFQGAFGAADGSEAYVVGRNGAIARGTPSANGFGFTNLTSGTTQELFDIWVSPGGVAYTAGRAGTLLKSTNHGASWAQAGSLGGQDVHQVFGFSDNEVIVTFGNGTIYRTTNGGLSWTPIRAGVGDSFAGLWGASPNEVYAMGREPIGGGATQGVIYHTHNGTAAGPTWHKNVFPTNRYMGGAWGDGAGTVLAGGSGGTVVLLSGHAAGGAEPPVWTPQPTGTAKDLFAVYGAGNVVFAVGASGTVITGVRP